MVLDNNELTLDSPSPNTPNYTYRYVQNNLANVITGLENNAYYEINNGEGDDTIALEKLSDTTNSLITLSTTGSGQLIGVHGTGIVIEYDGDREEIASMDF